MEPDMVFASLAAQTQMQIQIQIQIEIQILRDGTGHGLWSFGVHSSRIALNIVMHCDM